MKLLLKKFKELQDDIINANNTVDISILYRQAFGMYDAICLVCSAEIANEIGYVFDRIQAAYDIKIEGFIEDMKRSQGE